MKKCAVHDLILWRNEVTKIGKSEMVDVTCAKCGLVVGLKLKKLKLIGNKSKIFQEVQGGSK